MSIRLVMGNEAIGLGAIRAGVNVVCGYPGTPSTEVLETVAKQNPGDIYVEWSVNEKAALEVAAGASYSGARTLVTMKQVGLNVASDPLMSLNYIGIKGGMVIVVADDPGPISSQTEQDTRHYAQFSKMMVFDPSSPAEAYEMIQDAYDYSEKYHVPVFLRPTTRVCHSYQTIDVKAERNIHNIEGFVKDTSRWVIFPRLSYQNHIKLESKMLEISDEFSVYRFNQISGNGRIGIAASGISYEYVKEVIRDRDDIKLFKVATSNPFPKKMALEFLHGLKEVLVVEELDPVIEKALTYLCGKYHLAADIYGKLTGTVANAGEHTVEALTEDIKKFLKENKMLITKGQILPFTSCSNKDMNDQGNETGDRDEETELQSSYLQTDVSIEMPALPIRPPVLCAGCPHRASFYVVKKAMHGRKANYCGDIGCYTLGNAMPLDMVDTCLCMGADVTIAQGLYHTNKDTVNFAFIGDSTFFASGMTGVVNAVYNQANMVLVVLDNSTTAMTGHQPHPGTGRTMMGNVVDQISIEKLLIAIGCTKVVIANPFELEESIKIVKEIADLAGVKAVIFKSPCIVLAKGKSKELRSKCQVSEKTCIGCKRCINEIGCPGLVVKNGKVQIDETLCTGCMLCSQICPTHAIGGGKNE